MQKKTLPFRRGQIDGRQRSELNRSVSDSPLGPRPVLPAFAERLPKNNPVFFRCLHDLRHGDTGRLAREQRETRQPCQRTPPHNACPDLIDKSKTPRYFLEKCEGDPDFLVLRFQAGAPYEVVYSARTIKH